MSLKFEMNLDPEFSDESDYDDELSKEDDSESDIEVIFEKPSNSPKNPSSEIPKKGTWIVRLEKMKKCDQCTMYFFNQAELKQHKLDHRNLPKPIIVVPKSKEEFQVNEPQLMKTCDFCKQKFPDDQALRGHIKTLHMKVFYQSVETATSTKQTIPSVKTPVPNMKLFGCLPCEKAFSNGAKLKSHLKICKKQENKSTLETQSKNLAKVSKETGKFGCDKCDKVYTNQGILTRHKRIIHEKIRENCNQCGKDFNDGSALRSHIERIHLHITYTCDVCEKPFGAKRELKYHKLKLHGNESYECKQCNKHFSSKGNLKQHITIHVKDKMKSVKKVSKSSMCEKCNKYFSCKGNLNKHMTNVHGEKYNCKVCQKVLSKNGLNKHNKAFHAKDNSKHHCLECNRAFIWKSDLKNHCDSVHEKIRHQCNGCEKSFSSKGNLTTHVNRAHKFVKVEK